MKVLTLVLVGIIALFVGSCMEKPPAMPTEGTEDLALLKGPPNGGEEAQGNNLSFPALAADGYAISDVPEVFTVLYTGEYPGLTAEQIAYLEANGPWYPQKTEGNTWNADFAPYSGQVFGVDWGDNIESVNPMQRRPFRIEVRMFSEVVDMNGYTMGELEYPSSSSELQGTNTTTYLSNWATVVSNSPKFVIQYFGNEIPELTNEDWTGEKWADYEVIPMSFGPELNVGGKYIFGGSMGGWKPTDLGFYRLTFYIPTTSEIDLSAAVVGNFVAPDFVPAPPAPVTAAEEGEEGEGGAAFPVVVGELNLTYVDVEVVKGGGKGGGGKGGGGGNGGGKPQ